MESQAETGLPILEEEEPAPAAEPEPAAPPVTPPPTEEHPQAANIATAREMHQGLGYDLERAGAWLHATAAGAFESVEDAIKHIA